MSTQKLSLLKTYRKRAGLTQSEVGKLLGCKSDVCVLQLEHKHRLPDLETTIAYQTIFGVPLRKLFPYEHEMIRRKTAERAKQLAGKISSKESSKTSLYKLQILENVVERGN